MTHKIQSLHSEAEQARMNAIRARFQKDRPSLEELVDSGDAESVVPLGEFLSLLELTRELKRIRQEQDISLSEVARRANIDKGALSRLENDVNINPTFATLVKYANALGVNLRWALSFSKIESSQEGKPCDRTVYRRDDGKWANKRNDVDKASSLHKTQRDAINAGRETLHHQGGGELTIKGRDGQIRSKDTISPGKTPSQSRKPRGTSH